jgi:hypothetical protein
MLLKHTELFHYISHSGQQQWYKFMMIIMGWTLQHASEQHPLQAFTDLYVTVEWTSSVLVVLGHLHHGLMTTFSFTYDGNFLLNTIHSVTNSTRILLLVAIIKLVEGYGLEDISSKMEL